MNFRVYQIGVSRSFSELAKAFSKCKDTQILTNVEDVNTSMPEIFMLEFTDLPFYHVILASEDIFGRLFLGSRTVRVNKSMWQRPCWCTSLGAQTNLAIIICYFY